MESYTEAAAKVTEMLESRGITLVEDNPAIRALVDARQAILRTREELAAEAESLAERMTRIAGHAREGLTVNELGEVQSRGSAVDRLCALVREREQNYLDLLRYTALWTGKH